MKKTILVFLLVLIPLMAMSNEFEFSYDKLNKILPQTKFIDRNWRLNQIIEEEYHGMTWENSSKNFYAYNDVYPTRLDTIIYSEWNSDLEIWTPYMKGSYTYDATNEYVTELMTIVNMGSGYIPFAQSYWTYDNENRVTSQTIQFRDFDTMEWYLFMRVNIIYVSNSNYTVHSYMAANDEDPEQWSRMSFTWDTQGRVVTETDMSSPDSLTWTNDYRYTETYHPNDTSTGDSFVYNLAHTMWTQQVEHYDYLAEHMFGMISEEIEERWESGLWINNSRDTYTYNTNNKLIQKNNYFWDTDQSTWQNSDRILYDYDANHNMSQAVTSYWNFDTWNDDKRFTLSWGQDVANDDDTTPPVNAMSIIANPNPFTSELSVRVNSKTNQPVEVSVYNSRGQLVKILATDTNTNVNWDGKDTDNRQVSNGIYFIKAASAGQTTTIKTLKMK